MCQASHRTSIQATESSSEHLTTHLVAFALTQQHRAFATEFPTAIRQEMNRIACKHLAGGNWHYSCSFRTLSGICSVVATVVKNNDLSEHGFKLFKNICEQQLLDIYWLS